MVPKNRARSHPPKSYPAIPAIIDCLSINRERARSNSHPPPSPAHPPPSPTKGASAIKLFGWEQRIMDEVMEKRKVELSMVMRTQLCGAASQFLTLSVPAVVSVATFTVFTKVR